MELEGKIIDFLGDSITEGCGVENLDNRFDNVMLRKYKLKEVYNYGIGGTRLAYQQVPSNPPRFDLCFCGRAFNLNPDADIIIVYGGINDYLHGDAYIGKDGDTNPATFYGAVEFITDFMKKQYPGKTIVFMTPAHCNCDGGSDLAPAVHVNKKPDAMPLKGYVDIIKEKAEKHGYPVIDLYNTFPIDPHNEEQKEKYTADGLHFNDDGHKILADFVADFLEKL